MPKMAWHEMARLTYQTNNQLQVFTVRKLAHAQFAHIPCSENGTRNSETANTLPQTPIHANFTGIAPHFPLSSPKIFTKK